jgi:signal transduction histidine kinase
MNLSMRRELVLQPSVRLMQRLSYPYKFALIGLLAAAALLYQFAVLAGNVAEQIETADLELAGLAVDQSLTNLFASLQRHRALSVAVAGGMTQLQGAQLAQAREVDAALVQADAAMARYAGPLRLDAQWTQIHMAWAQLREGRPPRQGESGTDPHQTLLRQLLTLIATVTDNSRLILDPQADSYNLMDAVALKFPVALDRFEQLRTHALRVMLARRLEPAEHDQFVEQMALMRLSGEELEAVLRKLYPAQSEQSRQIAAFAHTFSLQREQMAANVMSDVLRQQYSVDPLPYSAQGAAALELGHAQVQQQLIPSLRGLLEVRSAQGRQQLRWSVALAVLFMALLVYFALGAYASVVRSIAALRRGADRLAGGDLATPIVLQSHDELSGVADSLNQMAAQLALRTHQLQASDATLTRLLGDYERDRPLARMAAVLPALAHDLNTPLHNAELATATMRDRLTWFDEQAKAGKLKRDDVGRLVAGLGEGLDILTQATRRANDLAVSLKSITVDQASERRRVFELGRLVDEVLVLLSPSLQGAPWHIECRVAPGLALDSYPGALGQVLINLVQNAAVHAFVGRDHGLLLICAAPLGAEQLQIEVQDDGAGMDEQTLANLFTPFFTSKMAAGGSGVGLAYSHKLVCGLLGGTLDVASRQGAGATFRLRLPRVAPDQALSLEP